MGFNRYQEPITLVHCNTLLEHLLLIASSYIALHLEIKLETALKLKLLLHRLSSYSLRLNELIWDPFFQNKLFNQCAQHQQLICCYLK